MPDTQINGPALIAWLKRAELGASSVLIVWRMRTPDLDFAVIISPTGARTWPLSWTGIWTSVGLPFDVTRIDRDVTYEVCSSRRSVHIGRSGVERHLHASLGSATGRHAGQNGPPLCCAPSTLLMSGRAGLMAGVGKDDVTIALPG